MVKQVALYFYPDEGGLSAFSSANAAVACCMARVRSLFGERGGGDGRRLVVKKVLGIDIGYARGVRRARF